jgi:aminoglycoside phosphotransferase (APT) family kinase protein
LATDDEWLSLAGAGRPASGLYHDNYQATVVVRVRRPLERPDVEPRMFHEAAVLAALGRVPAPRLLHESDQGDFIVISHLPGRRLADLHPAGTPAPGSFTSCIADVMRELYHVERAALGAVRPDSPWVDEAFLPGLLSWLTGVYEAASEAEKNAIGLPPDPFSARHFPVPAGNRRFRLCHGDLQRANVLSAGDGAYSVLDWEMALWADPVWDIASHMHRAAYPPDQRRAALDRLLATCPEWTDSADDRLAYDSYLRLEQLRSLVLDRLRSLRNHH